MNNIFYSEKSIHTSAVSHAILSTGQPFIYLSKTDFFNFKQFLMESDTSGSITCPFSKLFGQGVCKSPLPCSNITADLGDLTIRLNNMSYIIPPAGYLIDNYDGDGQCVIAVSFISDSNNMYILGDPFIRSFFTSFDYKQKRVLLAVSANAPDGTRIDRGQILNGWQIFGIFIAITIGALMLCIGSWCFVTRCVI